MFESRWLYAAVAGVSLATCNGDAAVKPCDRAPAQTLVFVDQSASSVVDSQTAAMFRDTLSALTTSALECKGDAIHAFLVHGNTRGKVGRVDVTNGVVPPDTVRQPSMRKARESARYERQIDSLRTEGRQRLSAMLTAEIPSQFRGRTDMLGTLEVISDQIVHTEGETTPGVRVYFLGDMHESMPSPRRDFDARPPRNRAEAYAWADADTALLQTMSVRPDRLRHARVRVLLGNLANKPGAAEVRPYWERIFQHVGVDPAHIRYN